MGVISHIRRQLALVAGMLIAFMPLAAVIAMPQPVGATGEYANGAIADKALQYVGRWGGQACIDSRKPGDSGGQCRAFVNCIVWMVSGGTQNLGGSYFNAFVRAGGEEIRSLDALQKGDIVQIGHGVHTFIIVSRVDGNVFTVVDSNHRRNERVSTYNRTVALTSGIRAFRMGINQPQAAPATAPAQPIAGELDSLEPVKDGVIARGWTLDTDVTRPISVKLFAGDTELKPENGTNMTVKADAVRMDVATQYPRHGASHGFRAFMPLPKGDYIICAYGLNAPGTPGDDTKLGCRAVKVE